MRKENVRTTAIEWSVPEFERLQLVSQQYGLDPVDTVKVLVRRAADGLVHASGSFDLSKETNGRQRDLCVNVLKVVASEGSDSTPASIEDVEAQLAGIDVFCEEGRVREALRSLADGGYLERFPGPCYRITAKGEAELRKEGKRW